MKSPRQSSISVATRIYERLLSEIVTLELKPREHLREKDLSERLGASRTPVREALLRLEAEEFVDIFPQHGTFVAPIRLEKIADIQLLRTAIEVEVVRTLAAEATAHHVGELEDLLTLQVAAAQRGDGIKFFRLDQALHAYFFEALGRPGLWRIVSTNQAHIDRVRVLHLPGPRATQFIVEEHTRIVEAIKMRSAPAVDEAMRAHLGTIWSIIDRLRAEHPNYFEVGDNTTGSGRSEARRS